MCQQDHSGCWVENRLQGDKSGGRGPREEAAVRSSERRRQWLRPGGRERGGEKQRLGGH